MKRNFLFAIFGFAVISIVLMLIPAKKKSPLYHNPQWGKADSNTNAETRQTVPPLPAGEGRGEGENSVQSNAPAFTESTNVRVLIRTNLHSLIPAPDISPLPPTTVLDNARVIIHNYAAQFGENPVGDNAEITAALMGKNDKQINFLREDSGLRVNDKGELLDAWGTPFFFHQLAADRMEIRSAGEDKKLWTLDDQVTR